MEERRLRVLSSECVREYLKLRQRKGREERREEEREERKT
jgi:hypothetical protein